MKDGGGLGLAREFAVVDLVRPSSQRARRGDFGENVGAAKPVPCREAALGDDFDSALHARQCFYDGFGVVVDVAQVHDGGAVRLQQAEVGGLMPQAQLLNDGEVGRAPGRSGKFVTRDAQIEDREMGAGQVVAEVGGGEAQSCGLSFHGRTNFETAERDMGTRGTL